TIERLAIGAVGRLVGPLAERPGPDGYEAALAPIYALAHELSQSARSRGGARARRSLPWRVLGPGRGDRPPRVGRLGPALPAAIAGLNALGLGPLRADVDVADLE